MQDRHLKFGECLLKFKLLTEAELEKALQLQTQSSTHQYLGEILIQQEMISEKHRDQILLLQKLLTSAMRLSELEIPADVLRLIPAPFAKERQVLPLLQIDDILVLAVNQHNEHLQRALETLTECQVYTLAYRAQDMQEALFQAYDPQQARQNGMEWIPDEFLDHGPILTFVGTGDACGSGGRNQTCLHLQSDEACFLIDCGPTTVTAMKQLNLPSSQLDGILLTHGHGDHFAGVPFVLLDQHEQGRTRSLWIMATEHVIETVQAWNQLCYGSLFDRLSYEVRWISIETEPRSIPATGIMVYPFAMRHQTQHLCLGYQIHLPEEHIIAYTGDTAWNENLEQLARDTDLLICECSFFEPPADVAIKHLSYAEIKAQQDLLKTRHLVLTHMGQDMLQKVNAGRVEIETAFDGMTIALGTKVQA